MVWQDVVAMARAAAVPQPLDTALTDTFGRKHSYLRISLTERCNLRCLYCMPAEGVDLTPRPELMSVDEIERVTRLFAAAGVTKVRLTGGEPTLRRDLAAIVRRVAAVPGVQDVGLTSTGLTLGRSLSELKHAGLTLLNVSLDTLRPDRFEAMTRRPAALRRPLRRGGQELPPARVPRHPFLHYIHDLCLLRGLQPAAPDGGRQPEGLSVWR